MVGLPLLLEASAMLLWGEDLPIGSQQVAVAEALLVLPGDALPQLAALKGIA
jgi:hypothetical protein